MSNVVKFGRDESKVKTNSDLSEYEKYDIAVDKFIDYLKQRSVNTKDHKDLKFEYGDLIPVFIYDTLMKGEEDSYILDQAVYFGPAITMEDDFALLRNKDHIVMFPNMPVIRTQYGLIPANFRRVEGELYGVTLDMLYYLDKVYANESMYTRGDQIINLYTKDRTFHQVKNCQVYMGEAKHWNKMTSYAEKPVVCPLRHSNHRVERVFRAFADTLNPLGIEPDIPEYMIPYRDNNNNPGNYHSQCGWYH